ncbi:MAG: hypothetical protein ACOX5G_08115 [Kiritimatiellia bacterium]
MEILTEGLLTQRLLRDPELGGVGLVIFDEFHERSLHADMGLALCLDVRSALRPDLRLAVMSATLDAGPLAKHLGPDTAVLVAEARAWPVETRLLDPPFRLPVRGTGRQRGTPRASAFRTGECSSSSPAKPKSTAPTPSFGRRRCRAA